MRALAIAAALPAEEVLFLGSDLKTYESLIPDSIRCLHLPMDHAPDDIPLEGAGLLPFGHYAPLGQPGLRKRQAMLLDVCNRFLDMLLVVDVSVEVALTARLSGIPFVYVRQHGDRTDLPHRLAYESAELIVAPYAEAMSGADQEGLYSYKTFFSNGFSRFSGTAFKHEPQAGNLAVFIGRGGSSLDSAFIRFMSGKFPAWRFHVIGQAGAISDGKDLPGNCVSYGIVHDPRTVLAGCEAVIANGGHNTVMELLDLDLPFICVPEERPFQEQKMKAEYLRTLGLAELVRAKDVYNTDWMEKLKLALKMGKQRDYRLLIDPEAPRKIAEALRDVRNRLFNQSLNRSPL